MGSVSGGEKGERWGERRHINVSVTAHRGSKRAFEDNSDRGRGIHIESEYDMKLDLILCLCR